MDSRKLLAHILNTCGLFAFPIHSITQNGACTCRKGTECSSPGKHPYLNLKWKQIATNSLQRLDSWAKKREINYAVCTGRKSEKSGKYLIVVDVDKQDHEIIQTLPKTFSYKTGSGGYHYWFWSPVEIKNSVSQLAEKVDIRGTGGYVIIPPSKHASGSSYELLCEETQVIADLPEDLLANLIKMSHDNPVKTKGKQRSAGKVLHTTENLTEVVSKWWTRSPVPALRQSLAAGTKIPMGVRNIVVHRLLSSDRAKGAATYDELFSNALQYRAMMTNSDTFEERELRNIVCSVMRYPVYNNEVENVNKNYAKWMSRFSEKQIDAADLDMMDDEFFSRLRPCESGGISLNSLAQVRKEWYHTKGRREGFATYRTQLLAKKLTSLGFERVRTAKQNLWKVDISQVFAVQNEAPVDYPTERTQNIMSDENEEMKVDENTTENGESEVTEEEDTSSNEHVRLGPDGKPLTLIEEREEVIKTKRKYHPNDEKYCGRESSQEQMSALIKFYAELTPEQEKDYENGVLLFDEERTRDWLSFVQKDDIIGIKNQMYKVLDVSENEIVGSPRGWDKYERKATFETEPETISVYDLDLALSLGHGEILYRNNVPFGLEEEMEYKVRVKVYADSVGRTYVFRSGREIVKDKGAEDKKSNE